MSVQGSNGGLFIGRGRALGFQATGGNGKLFPPTAVTRARWRQLNSAMATSGTWWCTAVRSRASFAASVRAVEHLEGNSDGGVWGLGGSSRVDYGGR